MAHLSLLVASVALLSPSRKEEETVSWPVLGSVVESETRWKPTGGEDGTESRSQSWSGHVHLRAPRAGQQHDG